MCVSDIHINVSLVLKTLSIFLWRLKHEFSSSCHYSVLTSEWIITDIIIIMDKSDKSAD